MTEPEAAAPAQRLNVLVTDDSDVNRDVAVAFLRKAGHATSEARDGGKAVRLAAARDFDVVLMDMRMPGMDGLEATRRIRALDGPRGQVPIVAVTANALDQHAEECRRAGMSEHLAKPFTQAELLAVVARAAGQRPQPAADTAPTIDADSRGAACRLHGRGCTEAAARLSGAADRVPASPARGSGQIHLAGRTCRAGARTGWQCGNPWFHSACRGRAPLRELGCDRAVPADTAEMRHEATAALSELRRRPSLDALLAY